MEFVECGPAHLDRKAITDCGVFVGAGVVELGGETYVFLSGVERRYERLAEKTIHFWLCCQVLTMWMSVFLACFQ